MTSFVGATQAGFSAGAITLARPSGLAAGDVLVAVLRGSATTYTSWTPPSGWAELYAYNGAGPGAGPSVRLYWLVATAAEPATYGFAFTNGDGGAGVLAAYRGVVPNSPPIQAGTGTGASLVAPSISPTGPGRVVSVVTSSRSVASGATAAPPGDVTERADIYDGGGLEHVAVGDFTHGGGVATGTKTWTAAPTFDTVSAHVTVSLSLVTANEAPNAPTLTTLVGGEVIDRAAVNRASHTFSDPNTGDSQSAFDHQFRLVGGATWTTAYVASPNSFVDYPAGTFAAGDYERQVRTYDSQGVVGPWSASGFFTAADAPAAPTITDPVNGATIQQTQDVTWSTPDQASYQLRRVADNAGTADTTTVYYDTGEVASTTARTATLTFSTNNRYEHLQVRIKDGGLWSSWASVRVLVSYTPPPTPVVSLLADDEAGSLVVTITNPTPGAGEPAVSYNDIFVDDGNGEFRAATMVTPNTSWTYWLPKSARDYAGNVRAVAVGDNGTTASSA